MATPDMDVIKEVPGYKVILKAVLKSQIQQLVEQLASSTDEESVILTASVSDGTLSHLGSDSGQAFLEDREDFKSEFLGFCLKRHHKKQQDKERLEAQKREEALARSMQAVTPPQYRNMGPQPGFMPRRSPRYHSPHQQQGLHPVGMTQLPGSPLSSTQNRYQPYSTVRPTRPAIKSPQNKNRQNVTPSKIDGQVIKIEPDDDASNQNANETSSVHTPSRTEYEVQDSSRSSSPAQKSSTPSRSQGPAPSDNDDAKSDTSSSTIPNEASDLGISDTGPPGGLSLGSDLSNLISGTSETPQGFQSEPPTPVGLDPNVSVKLESVADSEMDLEITGVELGQGPSHSQQEWLGQMDNMMQGASGSSADMGADLEPYSQLESKVDELGEQEDTSDIDSLDQDANDSEIEQTENSESERGHTSNSDSKTEQHGKESFDISYTDKMPHSGIVNQCGICKKEYQSKHTLKRHIKSHDEKSIKCSACTRYFTSEEEKNAHIVAKHSRVYMCDVCGKTFKRQSGCNEHMKNMHSSSNSQTFFECPYESCCRRFTRKTLYQDHLNKHSDTQPYSCDKCGKAFYGRYAKSAHEKLCGSDEHPYKCSECDMAFLYQTSLNHHIKGVHGQTLFTCACGAHYKYETGLFRHKKKHKHK